MKLGLALLGTWWLLAGEAQNRTIVIRRLDGTTITAAEAHAFATKTLSEAHVTGAQIAIVDRGALVWSAAFGTRRLEPMQPMATDTATWAASITKGVFGVYVMQLVERREFQLDVPVARMLPEPLDTYEPYREKATTMISDPAWPSITPRMLLAHTSGLANFAALEPDKKMHLHFKPGSQYRYSGEGLNLLQFVIEQRRQQPLQQLMEEAIFKPLSMSRTSMIFQKEFADNIADRFDVNEKFISQTRRFPARAAGSMTTTAEDLARFAGALLTGKVIKPSTRKALLAPHIQIRTLHQFPQAENEPEGEEAKAVGLAYGMGWGLLTKTQFGPAFFKEGHGDGAQNYMICFQKRRACMILLTNSDNGERAFRPLLEKIFGNTATPWDWEGY